MFLCDLTVDKFALSCQCHYMFNCVSWFLKKKKKTWRKSKVMRIDDNFPPVLWEEMRVYLCQRTRPCKCMHGSVIHNGSGNLLSGWCGFWDTFITLSCWCLPHSAPLLNHVSTWSHASKPPEPENTDEQTAAQRALWEHWPFTMSLSVSLLLTHTHTPLLFETFFQLMNFLLLCQNGIIISDKVTFYYSGLLIHFWIRQMTCRLVCVCCHVNIQPWGHHTMDLFKCPSIFINIKKKIVKRHLYLFFLIFDQAKQVLLLKNKTI